MIQSQKTTLPSDPRPGEERIGADAAQRDRRYRHAIAGWFATGMRARARELQRSREEEPGGQPARSGLRTADETQPTGV
jgi:hypothetical protein